MNKVEPLGNQYRYNLFCVFQRDSLRYVLIAADPITQNKIRPQSLSNLSDDDYGKGKSVIEPSGAAVPIPVGAKAIRFLEVTDPIFIGSKSLSII